jgi:hypothetical protein
VDGRHRLDQLFTPVVAALNDILLSYIRRISARDPWRWQARSRDIPAGRRDDDV